LNQKKVLHLPKKQMDTSVQIKQRIDTILSYLNERQSRLYLANEALSYGWGGISLVSQISGKSPKIIQLGIKELKKKIPEAPDNRIRRAGGGRKREKDKQVGLEKAILDIVEAHTVGDPMRVIMWTSKSVRHIQQELQKQGYKVSHESIRQILRQNKYSLQSNRRTQEGGNHPDRDAQFEFINNKSKRFIASNQPVISVDCKKKELIGNYKNNGKEWEKVKNPTEVNVYDFIDKTNGKASPYGVYDVNNNRGWVCVGTSNDTASFSVSTIRSWWENDGKILYPKATKIYINADGGGSNGLKNRLWKSEIQQFANDTGLKIHVSHLPAGTSKWNKIEHRLFSYISINWRGKPLTSLAIIIGLINGTTTTSGLMVTAKLDESEYKTGIKISDEEFEKINLKQYKFHGEWNYIIRPN
jgi:transposase